MAIFSATPTVSIDLPSLTPEAKQVLTLVVESDKAVDGSSLLESLGFNQRDKVRTAVRELQALRFINVGGSTSAEDFPFAKIAVRPSAREYLANIVRFLK